MTTAHFRKTDFIAAPQTDARKKTVIAVDGPAASGKGTLARKLAERLGYAYLDTGALYRAVGLATLEMGGNPAKAADVLPAVAMVQRYMTAELQNNPALRAPEVSDAASKVAAIPDVRAALLDFQRDFAQNPPDNMGGAVLDGRDIGTVVCPDADVKFFITASIDERARRRYEELKTTRADRGVTLTVDQVKADLARRDERDSTRDVAPTATADDAFTIDTTTLDAQATLDSAISIIRARFLAATDEAAAG